MATQSILYHAFGLINYNYRKTEFLDGMITFFIEKKRDKQKCAGCGSRNVSWEGGEDYRIQTIPIGTKQVYLNAHLKKLLCKDCGCSLQEERKELARPRKTYSRALERFVLDLSEVMTIQDIANRFALGWHKVRDIIKDALERKLKRRSWAQVEMIGIDEFAIQKGHKYMTIVVDLESGIVLEVVEGRKAEDLEPVFKRLKRAGAKLKAVAMDMSSSFRKAVQTYCSEDVVIVHDPFHVIQAMNGAVDEVRRDEQARLETEGKKVIKGNRYLLLTGRENLEAEDEKNAKEAEQAVKEAEQAAKEAEQAAKEAEQNAEGAEQSKIEKNKSKKVKKTKKVKMAERKKTEKEKIAKEKAKKAKKFNKVKRLDAMLAINEKLNQAYLLKEDLRQIWCQASKSNAKLFLQNWIEEARGVDLAPITRMAKTVEKHMTDLLAWYDYPISTGPLEGLNNKIKNLKRRGYGYRNLAFFRLLVLFIHKSKFRLSGT